MTALRPTENVNQSASSNKQERQKHRDRGSGQCTSHRVRHIWASGLNACPPVMRNCGSNSIFASFLKTTAALELVPRRLSCWPQAWFVSANDLGKFCLI